MSRSVGFIGLGIMGAHMARRLVEAGHRVTVYNRTVEKATPLVKAGARQAITPREAAEGNEAVFTMVVGDREVEEVILGPYGALHGAAP